MRRVDREGDLHEIKGKEGVNAVGGEDVLVVVAVEAVMGVVGGAENVAAGAIIDTHRAVLEVESVAAWIVHELAVASVGMLRGR